MQSTLEAASQLNQVSAEQPASNGSARPNLRVPLTADQLLTQMKLQHGVRHPESNYSEVKQLAAPTGNYQLPSGQRHIVH